ncbi:PH domain-containing protein [Barnesiella sp. CU968]|jgi:hypothetical protein|uniref:PH domain-containing protein n=1 Tax=Barnesiella sp. CU968 TaxID=2780099 RepID=UPI00195CAB6D|nr:PH domain-containing protein [Barnesiella sp. CU968]MBJ2196279.1 PH domain-containing protein [Muribaculaceae bacterium]
MEKFGGTKYNSMWDGSTWLMLGLVAACCLVPCFIDHSLWLVTLCLAMLAFVLLTFQGIYYRIDGDKLIVYSFFIPTAYPIDKIKEIKPTKSVLSAPATSLSHRLAITFTDRQILKSSIPLIISPVRQEEFIQHLLSINPEIRNNVRNK